MSVVRWSCLGLLLFLGAEASHVCAGPPSATPSPKVVQLDIVVAEAQPGVCAALAGRLRKQLPSQKIDTERTPSHLAAVLSSDKGKSAILSVLKQLEDEGFVKVAVQPRLATKSGQTASLRVGGLNILPVVLGNGRIHLEVEPEANKAIRICTKAELTSGKTFIVGNLLGLDEEKELIVLVTPTVVEAKGVAPGR
jgi:Flp pilus assembly secretin CpaC